MLVYGASLFVAALCFYCIYTFSFLITRSATSIFTPMSLPLFDHWTVGDRVFVFTSDFMDMCGRVIHVDGHHITVQLDELDLPVVLMDWELVAEPMLINLY